MTVSTETSRNTFTFDGVTTVFPFTFRINDEDKGYIKLYEDGVLMSPSLYSITVNANGVGGNITFSVAPGAPAPDTTVGTAIRELPYTQGLDIRDGEGFDEAAIENAFDRGVILSQQLKDLIARSLSLPLASSISPSVEAPTADEQVMYYDLASETIKWSTVSALYASAGTGEGDVVGPSGASDNAVALFDGTTGRVIKEAAYGLPASLGAAESVLKVNSGGTALEFGVTSNAGGLLKASQISEATEQLPTSGSWDQPVYYHYGDWESTGTITIDVPVVRVYVKGNFNLLHNITGTASAVKNGGVAPENSRNAYQVGGGFMGSGGQTNSIYTGYGGAGGGGNGGYGGKGGEKSSGQSLGSRAMACNAVGLHLVPGGGGSSGYSYGASYDGGDGGDGGNAFYLEVDGNISFGANVTLNGSAGGNDEADYWCSAGAGGAGGTLVSTCSGTWTLSATKTLATNGGNGAAGNTYTSPGSGGGGGRQYHRAAGVLTNSGSITVTAGNKGSDGAYGAGLSENGGAGVIDTFSEVAVFSLF